MWLRGRPSGFDIALAAACADAAGGWFGLAWITPRGSDGTALAVASSKRFDGTWKSTWGGGLPNLVGGPEYPVLFRLYSAVTYEAFTCQHSNHHSTLVQYGNMTKPHRGEERKRP